MKHLLAVVLFFASAGATHAQEYGYIRVIIDGPVVPHNSQVQLSANGSAIGMTFTHHTVGYPFTPLTVNHLSGTRRSTPIEAHYSFDPDEHCQFNFHVEFSLDGVSVLQKFPDDPTGFHAPGTSVVGYIPLGRNCKDGLSVCSDNRNLEAKIEKDYMRARVARFNREKAEYDQRIRARADGAEKTMRDTSKNLKDGPLPDFEISRQLLTAQIEQWSNTLKDIQSAAREHEVLPPEGEHAADDPAKIASEAMSQAESNPQGVQLGNLLGAPWLNKAIDRVVEREAEVLEEDIKSGEATQADIRTHERLEQNAEFFKDKIARGGLVVDVSIDILKATRSIHPGPLRAVIAFCEIATGREVCIGKKLSALQQAIEACKQGTKYLMSEEFRRELGSIESTGREDFCKWAMGEHE